MRLRRSLLFILPLASILVISASGTDDNDPKQIRWRMQRMLKAVSETVEKNFYDPKLNGVDWKAGVEAARKRIDEADHTGEMVAAITGLLARLNDSHTVFIPPGRTEHALFGFDAKPFGDDVLVYDVMPQGPAESAGLQVGDRILAVNDFRATRSNIDMMMRYFRYLNPNHALRLTISRAGNGQQVITIEAKLQSEFSKDFSHLYDTYASERKKDHDPLAKDYDSGIVYLSFPSLEVKRRNPNITAPLFVLVDSHSASASEMLARYLQLTHRGKIVGDRTSGRVNAARIFPGVIGSVYGVYYAIEIAVARAVMVGGDGLEGKGVLPDEVCVPTADDLRAGRDPCLSKALELAGGGGSAEKMSSPK